LNRAGGEFSLRQKTGIAPTQKNGVKQNNFDTHHNLV
jgi:hypothetical protein